MTDELDRIRHNVANLAVLVSDTAGVLKVILDRLERLENEFCDSELLAQAIGIVNDANKELGK